MDAAGKALIQAACDGSVPAFDKACGSLPKGAAPTDVRDDAGANSLHVAAGQGHAQLVGHLVDSHGFDVNTAADGQGEHIHMSIYAFITVNAPQITKLCHFYSFSGRTAVGVAVAADQPAALRELLSRGGAAATTAPNATPHILAACSAGRSAALGELLSAGADPNGASPEGMAAVFLAAAMAGMKLKLPGRAEEAAGGLECVQRLLTAGANPNVAAPGGFTPLHVAAESGSAEMTAALLAAGADASAKTSDGQTPAAVAASWGHRAVAEVLIRAGATDDTSQTTVDELMKEAEAREAARREATAAGASGATSVPAPEDPDPAKAEALKKEGNAAFVAGDYEKALELYRAALRHATDAAALWSNAAAAALRLERWQEALRDARVARSVDPKFVKAWYREGQAAEGLEAWDEAAAAYFEAYELQGEPGAGDIDFADLVRSAVRKGKKANARRKEEEEKAEKEGGAK